MTLELGGKSPQLVFADADQAAALPFIVNGIVQNAGQTCSAGSRVLVQDRIYDEFVDAVAQRFKALRVGASDMDLDVGPVINAAQKSRVASYLDLAERDGLRVLGQGRIAPNVPPDGFYVTPTLIGDVPPDHRLAQEEIFGPVLVAMRFTAEEDAIRLANGTPFPTPSDR